MTETGTLTRADLAEAISRNIGFSRAESLIFVEGIINHMSDALVRGENVKIANFGSFLLRDKTPRIGRNPKTLDEVTIAARRVLTFRASGSLKESVAPVG